MGIFIFIVALLLAIPTYGLSILAWLALMFFSAKGKANKINRREEVKTVLEPLFNGKFSEFFLALDLPVLPGQRLTEQEAHQGGRHILNYIAHNSEEAALFMKGLERWRTKGTNELCDPVTAAEYESDIPERGAVHLVSYRAIEAITTNNRNVRCFDKIEMGKIMLDKARMELGEAV